MTDREKFAIGETKERIFLRDKYKCQHCGLSIYRKGTPQLAHVISQSKANIEKYGKEIIHNDNNLLSACCLFCNAALACGKTNEANKAEEIKEKD